MDIRLNLGLWWNFFWDWRFWLLQRSRTPSVSHSVAKGHAFHNVFPCNHWAAAGWCQRSQLWGCQELLTVHTCGSLNRLWYIQTVPLGKNYWSHPAMNSNHRHQKYYVKGCYWYFKKTQNITNNIKNLEVKIWWFIMSQGFLLTFFSNWKS